TFCGAVLARRLRIPRSPRPTNPPRGVHVQLADRAPCSHQISRAKTPHASSAWRPSHNRYVGAKSIHGRTSRFAALETRGLACPAGLPGEAGSESQDHERLGVPEFRASYSRDAQRASCCYVRGRRPRRDFIVWGGAKSSIASKTPHSLSILTCASR